MLTLLGVATIAALLGLILFRVTSVLVALTLVPVVAALAGGFAGEIGGFAMDGIRSVAPAAALLAFAVVYFGVMNDAGLFEPFIRWIVRLVGDDPLKVALGTAAIAAIAHLDGAGASTFMVTVPAMLPLYARLRMDPAGADVHHRARRRDDEHAAVGRADQPGRGGARGLGLGALRAAHRCRLSSGVAAVFACAWLIGRRERAAPRCANRHSRERRSGAWPHRSSDPAADDRGSGGLWIFNAVLTLVTLVALVLRSCRCRSSSSSPAPWRWSSTIRTRTSSASG